ncbi:hypothetical protein B0H16DRAFT_1565651 [Mycena metata]|uniref:Secreted protein n=1 Tax=Mycena metata TaxID=1033252 RepID=A0AAD7N218_9AGAR|nr:hypothetical protein B0H16DRAFT_1565651 [Mycena metata]
MLFVLLLSSLLSTFALFCYHVLSCYRHCSPNSVAITSRYLRTYCFPLCSQTYAPPLSHLKPRIIAKPRYCL